MSKILKSVLFERTAPVIIKYRPAPEPVLEVVPELPAEPDICLDDVRAEAESIIAQAHVTADQYLADAKIQAQEFAREAREEGHSQGYQAGFDEGHQAALADMQQTMQLSLEKADRIIKVAEQEAYHLMIDAERQVVEIALAVAGKVLARELEENPATILPIVKEALGKVRDQDHIVIRVNPEDYEMVLMAKRDLQLMVGREHAVNVCADHIVPGGGCVIDTALGTVDAKLDTKLEMVHKAIRETLP
ncbi:FliH/SctL family protein [Sporomusa sp.]|uniref:FliH/SctL family protein n=1 Tax=Sporomusa sp. TaxID=2078658 RepID=UPI0029765875|nr:FliH/SctL family protein [Sporomusa sp.]MDF2571012.1 yscL [Sporomusa sp.]HWR05348.1 FliH/SctL family protein [Sporomusa sp.]